MNKCPTSSRQKNAKQKHTKNRVCAVCMTFLAARRRMCNHPNFFKQISEMTFSFFLSLPNHELKFTSGGQKQGQSQMPGNEVPGGDLICFIKTFWREDVGCFIVRFNKNVLRDELLSLQQQRPGLSMCTTSTIRFRPIPSQG